MFVSFCWHHETNAIHAVKTTTYRAKYFTLKAKYFVYQH